MDIREIYAARQCGPDEILQTAVGVRPERYRIVYYALGRGKSQTAFMGPGAPRVRAEGHTSTLVTSVGIAKRNEKHPGPALYLKIEFRV